jgi:IS30 family transposase
LEKNRISKKRGQLGLDEEKYIKENVHSLSVEQIAENLNRHPGPIKRYISENNLLINPEEKLIYQTLKDKLHSKTFWNEITRQFDEETGELQYFEDTWVGLIKQFREDVLPAEELQIKQFITIDILINRSMKERKRHIAETEKLQKLVDKEYEKEESQRDIPKLANLETQLSFARNSIANYTNEYTKLLNEQQKISKDLKATREQRIKRIEDGKSSWVGLIRMLEDEMIREKEGREMEILSMAAQKSKNQLQEYHTYQDGVIDIPLLTPEFMEKNHE